MADILLTNAVLIFVYMNLVFAIARARDRLDTVDVAWGLGFILVAWATALHFYSTSSALIALLVTIWGARLANHIYRRSKGKSDDRRYQELSSKWKGNLWLRAYVSVFLLQGLMLWIISLPVMLAGQLGTTLGALGVIGLLLWLIGFGIEAMADKQLSVFLKQKPRTKVMQTGLWRYSRHPNYFGELLQWWSIGMIALSANYGWVGLIGPLILSVLIIFVSGIPPIEKRRMKDPEFRAYQKRTSVLVPLPPRDTA